MFYSSYFTFSAAAVRKAAEQFAGCGLGDFDTEGSSLSNVLVIVLTRDAHEDMHPQLFIRDAADRAHLLHQIHSLIVGKEHI